MLLVAGENGLGKRTPFDDESGPVYRLQSRGGKGIITMKTNEKTGGVAGALTVRETDELMLITNKGKMVRTKVSGIRATGRNAQGVILINMREGESSAASPPWSATRRKKKATHPEQPHPRSRKKRRTQTRPPTNPARTRPQSPTTRRRD